MIDRNGEKPELPPDREAGTGPEHSAALLRLLLGGAAEGSDRLIERLSPTPATEGDGTDSEFLRYALIGLLFDAYDHASRGASAVGRVAATAGRMWWAMVEPFARSPLLEPIRRRSETALDRWVRIGRAEERRGRDMARDLVRAPIDDVVAYLRENPELRDLVRKQAETLLAELPDEPNVDRLVRTQADRYVAHLRENPEPIQELVHGHSVGLASEVRDRVRGQAVTADSVLEEVARFLLRRRPRRDLPAAPQNVRRRAASARLESDD